ncbi:MAG: STN domain-containing protein [Comamonas sp.]
MMAWLACGVLMPAAAQGVNSVPLQQRSTHAQEPRVAVNIPAQPLLSALRAFGLQTQSQVLFHEALLSGRQAVAVYGAYTPQEALELLLASTGLTIGTVRARSFTLKVVQSVPQTSCMPRWTMPAIAIS